MAKTMNASLVCRPLRALSVALTASALAGCPSDPLVLPRDVQSIDDQPSQDVPNRMDGGGFDVPNAPRDVPDPRDTFVARDVQGNDRVDAAPSCPCPPIPDRCNAPMIEVPVFSPQDDSLARQLNDVVTCADTSLDMALYEVTSTCFVDVLLARLAANPMLTMRIVTDDASCPRMAGSNTLQCALARLDGHPRVTIVLDDRAALMHHKYIIADGRRIWIASANMSRNSFCVDENNAIVTEAPEVITPYRAEFVRMFEQRMFGPILPEAAPDPMARFSVYFSPRTPVTSAPRWHSALIDGMTGATMSLEFIASAFTRMDISDALVAASRRGVRVRGVVDTSYAMDPAVRALVTAGLDIRTANVHSKTLVMDGATVVTGSANWSTNAWSNNENSLWIRDANIAAAYRTEFDRVYGVARPIR
jgi:hypothetical protein